MTTGKRGIRTSEFWVSLATIAGTLVAALVNKLDPEIAAVIVAAVASIYTHTRGSTKRNG